MVSPASSWSHSQAEPHCHGGWHSLHTSLPADVLLVVSSPRSVEHLRGQGLRWQELFTQFSHSTNGDAMMMQVQDKLIHQKFVDESKVDTRSEVEKIMDEESMNPMVRMGVNKNFGYSDNSPPML